MDANRLEESAREAQSRRRALAKAQADVDKAKRRSRRDAEETQRLAQRVGEIELRLIAARRESAAHADTTGIAAAFSQSPLVDAGAEALLALTAIDSTKSAPVRSRTRGSAPRGAASPHSRSLGLMVRGGASAQHVLGGTPHSSSATIAKCRAGLSAKAARASR
jgi:hypothetical protein